MSGSLRTTPDSIEANMRVSTIAVKITATVGKAAYEHDATILVPVLLNMKKLVPGDELLQKASEKVRLGIVRARIVSVEMLPVPVLSGMSNVLGLRALTGMVPLGGPFGALRWPSKASRPPTGR